MSIAPFRIGSSPVRSAARLGAHDGEETKAWLNVIPAAANRAMFGVRPSFPLEVEQSAHPRSSARKTTMSGRSAAGTDGPNNTNAAAALSQIRIGMPRK